MFQRRIQRPERYILAGLAAILMFGYQNCSNSMKFDAASTAAKSAGTSGINTGDGNDPTSGGNPTSGGDPTSGGNPNSLIPPSSADNDNDTDIDNDYDGHRVAFSCSTGATLPYSEAELAAAGDLTLQNVHRFISYFAGPLRNVTAENIHGSIGVKNALNINAFNNIHGIVSYARAVNVVSSANIEAAISVTAANKLSSLANVHAGYICGSGSEIGDVADLHGLLIKFRGRPLTGGANAKAKSFANLHAGFISIYKLDTQKISNVQGELIIRNSVIDSIENFHGGLTLINSKVKNLTNAEGTLRMLNSSVDTQVNVNMGSINLAKK